MLSADLTKNILAQKMNNNVHANYPIQIWQYVTHALARKTVVDTQYIRLKKNNNTR